MTTGRGVRFAIQSVAVVFRFFWAENNEGSKDSGRNFDLLPNDRKSFRLKAPPQVEVSAEISAKQRARCGAGTSVGSETRVPPTPVSQCLCLTQKTSVYQTSASPSSHDFSPFPSKPQTIPPASSFTFSWRWFLRWKLQSFQPVTHFFWVSPKYTCY